MHYYSPSAVSAKFGLVVDYPEDRSQENMLVFQFPHHVGAVTKDDLLTQLCSLISSANNITDKVSSTPSIIYTFLCIIYLWLISKEFYC